MRISKSKFCFLASTIDSISFVGVFIKFVPVYWNNQDSWDIIMVCDPDPRCHIHVRQVMIEPYQCKYWVRRFTFSPYDYSIFTGGQYMALSHIDSLFLTGLGRPWSIDPLPWYIEHEWFAILHDLALSSKLTPISQIEKHCLAFKPFIGPGSYHKKRRECINRVHSSPWAFEHYSPSLLCRSVERNISRCSNCAESKDSDHSKSDLSSFPALTWLIPTSKMLRFDCFRMTNAET